MKEINAKVKRPVDVFPKCPSCLMEHFLTTEGIHVFCGLCNWDSVQAYADAGGYEDARQNALVLPLKYGAVSQQLKLMLA